MFYSGIEPITAKYTSYAQFSEKYKYGMMKDRIELTSFMDSSLKDLFVKNISKARKKQLQKDKGMRYEEEKNQ
ncbi:hypothetical protein MHH33_01940 [Paenisporosarcina sp. FSL H8-0542]|uniref:hypothetical protein n=1 Tax=unclassified Paenisporosarcina TaxID=2642018 RepID=UPI00034EBD8A|nr:hypothetical protein [Paenisporosarcina sp. HGH0030]EPD49651.1 hypothetical protein HMPREF1210_03098 [Paenisporosarcina sp. HGH0030]